MRVFTHRVAGEECVISVPETREDVRDFERWLVEAQARGPVALDTEGTGLDWWAPSFQLRTVQFGDAHDAYVLRYERGGYIAQAVARALANPAYRWILHNAPYDCLVFDAVGLASLEDLFPRTEDTNTKAIMIDPRQRHAGGFGLRLKEAAEYWVDPDAPDTEDGLRAEFAKITHPVNGKPCSKDNDGFRYISGDNRLYLLYGGLDVILTARLDIALEREMTRVGVRRKLLPYEYELSRICATMRRTGLRTDVDYAQGLSNRLRSEKEEWRGVAQRNGVESPGSADQVRARLLEMKEKWSKRSKKTGELSTDKTVLLPMADLDHDWNRIGAREPNAVATAVLHYKRAEKWGSTYADKFAASGGRLHADIRTLDARTGRMTVTSGLHQLPSGDWTIRRGILAEPGHRIMSCDFSAVEMRVVAALAGVARMREGFITGGDDFDIHMFTAQLVKGPGATRKDRKHYKSAGLGKIYGIGPATMAEQTGSTLAQAQSVIRQYDRQFPEIQRTSARWQREARERGYVTVTATGRRLPLDRHRLYAVVNYQCQSAARDLLGTALIAADKAGLTPYMRLPIHDEILASVPEDDAADFARAFGDAMTMSLRGVPITADPELGGSTWGSLYMKDKDDKPIPELRIAHDPFYADHPELAAA